MLQNPELKKIEKNNHNNDGIENLNLTQATNERLDEEANKILSNTKNIDQVQFFPDRRNSLNPAIKQNIASSLTLEIQDCINELSDLGYSPEVTERETTQLAALEYVIKNKDIIPQSWVKLEQKANEIAKNIGVEINKKGILDNTRADDSTHTQPGNMFSSNNTYDNAA